MTWQLDGCGKCHGDVQIVNGESSCLQCGYSGPTIDPATLPRNYLRKGAKRKGDSKPHGKRKRQEHSVSGILQAGLPWRI